MTFLATPIPPDTTNAPVVFVVESISEVSLTFALDVVLDAVVISPPNIRISALSIVTFASALTDILPSSAEKIRIAESLKMNDLSVSICVFSLNVVFAVTVNSAPTVTFEVTVMSSIYALAKR